MKDVDVIMKTGCRDSIRITQFIFDDDLVSDTHICYGDATIILNEHKMLRQLKKTVDACIANIDEAERKGAKG